VTAKRLRFSLLPGLHAVCRLPAGDPIPGWTAGDGFLSITRTAEELSIVCPDDRVPEEVHAERGWRCLKVQGPLAFTEVGVVASFAAPLAEARIGIFVVSTYDTDYLLVKAGDLEKTVFVLSGEGNQVLLSD